MKAFCMFSIMAVAVLCACADAAAQAAPPAQKEAEGKGKAVSIDLNTASLYNLKESYKKDKAALYEPLKVKFADILQKNIDEAVQLYEQKKKTGNVKGMAVARDMKSMFSECLEQLNKTGEMKFPEKLRDELEDKVDSLKKEKETAELDIRDKVAALDAACFEKFKTSVSPMLAAAKVPPSDTEKILKDKFASFLKDEIKCPEPGMDKAAPADKKDAAIPPLERKAGDSVVIASKGVGSAWADIGEFYVAKDAGDVIKTSICLLTTEGFSDSPGAGSTVKYRVVKPLNEKGDFAFRLIGVEGRGGFEIVEWPSAQNNRTFILRTSRNDTSCACVIQYSPLEKDPDQIYINEKFVQAPEPLPGNQPPRAPEGANADNSAAGAMEIPVRSNPDGANIIVDGRTCMGKDGVPLKTPCTIKLTAAAHKIKVSKVGFIGKQIPDFTPSKGAVVLCNLEPDPLFKKFQVSANVLDWKATGINVKNGDKVVVSADGSWSCGEGKEKCGPDGYPSKDPKFSKYYLNKEGDLKLIPSGYYGCMLFKIGKEGAAQAYDPPCKDIKASADGEVFIGINELTGAPRKNNTGSVTVLIGINPPDSK